MLLAQKRRRTSSPEIEVSLTMTEDRVRRSTSQLLWHSPPASEEHEPPMRCVSIASAVKPPCFKAFLLPLGAPPPAPCIRQTLDPRTAGAWHRSPLRFDLAWHLNAWCIGKLCMGLILGFFPRPYPLGGRIDVSDDRLTTLGGSCTSAAR